MTYDDPMVAEWIWKRLYGHQETKDFCDLFSRYCYNGLTQSLEEEEDDEEDEEKEYKNQDVEMEKDNKEETVKQIEQIEESGKLYQFQEEYPSLFYLDGTYSSSSSSRIYPSGVNPRLRIIRYEQGENNPIHTDGSYQQTSQHYSKLTLLIYLQDECEGGHTNPHFQYLLVF